MQLSNDEIRRYSRHLILPEVGMAGRCVQGAIDVLEGRYGGDPKKMPFVVNKEAF
jgi:molybdopterin/thiamine biosynthesis adenylyltransferase